MTSTSVTVFCHTLTLVYPPWLSRILLVVIRECIWRCSHNLQPVPLCNRNIYEINYPGLLLLLLCPGSAVPMLHSFSTFFFFAKIRPFESPLLAFTADAMGPDWTGLLPDILAMVSIMTNINEQWTVANSALLHAPLFYFSSVFSICSEGEYLASVICCTNQL